jgi:hypothetical protein
MGGSLVIDQTPDAPGKTFRLVLPAVSETRVVA